MIAIGVRYLTGRVYAHDLSKQTAEWPPHPGRLFLAMAAAYFELGEAADEKEALLWLESQPAPALRVSAADYRSLFETYVPVNDTAAALVNRPRQRRRFPSAKPHEDEVYFVWPTSPQPNVRDAVERICGKLTRLGHSHSLIQAWVADNPPDPNLVPDDAGEDETLRVPETGTLHYLETSFNGKAVREYWSIEDELAAATGARKKSLQQEKKKYPKGGPQPIRPVLSRWQRYRIQREDGLRFELQKSPFDSQFIVLTKTDGINLGLESTLALTGALRNALMKAAKHPPEWLSGHSPDGAPSKFPHVACFPLPFVGSKHADGHIVGLGIAIPRILVGAVTREDALREYLGPLFFDSSGLPREVKIWRKEEGGDRSFWKWTLEREVGDAPLMKSLARKNWVGPSTRWATVTPVVLHHYPDAKDPDDAERIVREAFHSALLPEPSYVRLSPVSRHSGAGHVKDLPAYNEGDTKLCRYHVHVFAEFEQPVEGPMLVGRGRYRGYGLFRPLRMESEGKGEQ